MTLDEIKGHWRYLLSLEKDLDATSQYVEPRGQEHVYSFEFAKILILACTEAETVFKAICKSIDESADVGDIGKYKTIILGKFPRIVEANVSIGRLGKSIRPFEGWETKRLSWWDAYQGVKHSRGSHFQDANYINAVYALSALYVLILYAGRILDYHFSGTDNVYLSSEYINPPLVCRYSEDLPDFEVIS